MWCKVGDGEHSGQPCEADGWIDSKPHGLLAAGGRHNKGCGLRSSMKHSYRRADPACVRLSVVSCEAQNSSDEPRASS